MERRLGRGLGSLLGSAEREEAVAAPSTIRVELIRPNPFQPRTTFDPIAIQELAESIKSHGVLQPIVVRPRNGAFEIVAGERRWRAAQLAGLAVIPAVLREGLDDAQMLELALVENVQRRDLDPMERARGYQQLIDRLGLTQDAVATRVGIERSTVANHLRLLELPSEAQDSVRAGLISMGHARALLGLADAPRMRELLERIVREGLSVREVEASVRATKAVATRNAPQAHSVLPRPSWIPELEARLRARLGSRVKIEQSAGWRGKIVLEYFDRAGLDHMIECLLSERTL